MAKLRKVAVWTLVAVWLGAGVFVAKCVSLDPAEGGGIVKPRIDDNCVCLAIFKPEVCAPTEE